MMDKFQSTPPRGGRHVGTPNSYFHAGFQSTPPRGGRPVILLSMTLVIAVSIHAPAWGATHTLQIGSIAPPSFNPRPRVGGDVRR